MVNKLFAGIIGMAMEAYVDDMLVKFSKRVYDTKDLRKTFERLRLQKVCLNPLKCAFGIQSRQVLGYMVNIGE